MPTVEHDPNPLLRQAIRQEQNEALVAQLLLELKMHIGGLIAAQVSALDKTQRNFSRGPRLDDESDPRNGMSVRLAATVSLETKETKKMILSASGYPLANEPDSAQRLEYVVDVADHASVLVIRHSGAVLQSKKWEQEPFTSQTVVGSRPQTWPEWEHPATVGILQVYKDIVNSLSQNGVTFQIEYLP